MGYIYVDICKICMVLSIWKLSRVNFFSFEKPVKIFGEDFFILACWGLYHSFYFLRNMKVDDKIELQTGAKENCYYRILLSSRENQYYNIARVLALYKPYWAAMNKIFIYARVCVNKITWAMQCSQPTWVFCSAITVRQNNSVVVAQEKTASFLQSVFSNCTVHGSVNIILNNQNPW